MDKLDHERICKIQQRVNNLANILKDAGKNSEVLHAAHIELDDIAWDLRDLSEQPLECTQS